VFGKSGALLRETPAGGPSLHDLVFVWHSTRHGRCQGLIEEWHRMVRQIEQPCLYTDAFTHVLKNPTRRLFRKAALARAANNDGLADRR
jgi:hypothetical protein